MDFQSGDIHSKNKSDKPFLAIVIPTYNEAANLPHLVERLFSLKIPKTLLIIVDDSSPDGTAETALKLAQNPNYALKIIKREGKMGLGTAYVEGFSLAIRENAEHIIQMDADLSHQPEYIPAFMDKLKNADLVIGSRYVCGGGSDKEWSIPRKALSTFGNFCIRITAGLKVKDATSGFKAFRKATLLSLDLSQFKCKGFGFQAEVAYACERKNFTILEYPIIFENRTRGTSKMSLFIIFESICRLLLIRFKG
jgi:dolichol-phosphate mannosyltransferase